MTIYIFNQILNLYLIGLKIIIFHCTLENAVLCYLQEKRSACYHSFTLKGNPLIATNISDSFSVPPYPGLTISISFVGKETSWSSLQ